MLKNRIWKFVIVGLAAATAAILAGCGSPEPEPEPANGAPPATSSATPEQRSERASGRAAGGRGVVNN